MLTRDKNRMQIEPNCQQQKDSPGSHEFSDVQIVTMTLSDAEGHLSYFKISRLDPTSYKSIVTLTEGFVRVFFI